jgi:hypothetical protein
MNFSFEKASRFVEAVCKTSIIGILDQVFFLGGIVSGYLSGLPIWKTHIWITAEPGAGKSSLADAVLRPVSDPCDGHLAVGNITEAGIRQAIGNNSNIFIHDEAETSQNIDKEIELIRASSSGGTIVKGTQDQKGIEYTCSSLFYLLSISSSTTKLADEDRFVYVSMKQTPETQKAWDSIKAEFLSLAKEDFFYSLYYRCSTIAKTYIESINVFRARFIETIDAYVKFQSNRKTRAADKFAPLVCGRWHLVNDDVVTVEYCDEMIELISESQESESYRLDKENKTSSSLEAFNSFLDTIINNSGSITNFRKLIRECNNAVLSVYSVFVTVNGDLFIRAKNKNITEIFKKINYPDYRKMLSGLDGVKTGTIYVKYSIGDMVDEAENMYGILIPSKYFKKEEA